MAGGTNVPIDPEPTLELSLVVGTKGAVKGPALRRNLRLLLGGAGGLGGGQPRAVKRKPQHRQERRAEETPRHHDFTLAGGARFFFFLNTASVMLPGSWLGRSIQPTTGITTRKKPK